MAVDKTYITTIASEFADVTDQRIADLIAIVGLRVNSNTWGIKSDYATALLVMHYLKLDKQGGQGPIRTDQFGTVSMSFETPHSDKADALDLTVYGAEYKALLKTLVTTPLVT